MPITFATETMATFLPDAIPLLRSHWQEVGSCPQTHSLQMDTKLYAAIEHIGGLHITTARCETGQPTAELVGYAVYFVQDYPHVQALRMAQSDALYLAPQHRKGFTGLRLLQVAESALLAMGVKNIMQTCTTKRDFSCILRRMGYTSTETVYRKEV